MALIQPLTDISAGGAQVFDTSGFAGLYQRQEAEKDAKFDKLAKESLEYDPSGLFDKDVPFYKQLMTDYQDFVTNNNEALVNPSDNIELWRQKQKLENRIKNYVAGSKQKNQEYGVALQRFSSDPAWMNEYNIDYLDKVNQGTSLEDFDKGIGFMDILEGMERNLDNIKPLEQYASMVEKHMAEEIQSQDGMEDVTMGDIRGIMMGTKTDVKYDEGKVKKALGTLFEQQNAEANELAYKYRNEEDPVEAFYDDVMSWAREKGASDSRWISGGKSGGEPVKGQFAFQPQLGSSQTIVESGERAAYSEKEQKEAKRKGEKLPSTQGTYGTGVATVNQGFSTGDDYEKAGTSKGQVVRVDGMKIKIKIPITGATNLSTGKPVGADEGLVYKNSEIQEFGNYWWARKDLIIPLENGQKITVEEGTALPNLDELVASGAMTQKTKDIIMTRSNGNVRPGVGMVLVADPEQQDVIMKAGGAKYTETVSPSESGKIYAIMPIEGHEAAINSSLGAQFEDFALQHGGKPLNGILEPIQLDNSYFNFWSPQASGLR